MNTISDHSLESQWWDNWHTRVQLPQEPHALATRGLRSLMEGRAVTILELGFGQLSDARFFASQGFKVHGVDFSAKAVEMANEAIRNECLANITVQNLDYSAPLPFADDSFDAAYSHFSLHYFDNSTTFQVFSEIRRVLKKDGLLIFNVKSVKDWKYGAGNSVGFDMFDDAGNPGHIRHFFRYETLTDLLQPLFTILEIQECVVYYHNHDSHGYNVIASAKK